MKILGLIIFCSFWLTSCAHHRDVRPGASGNHRVIVRGEEKNSCARAALKQADHFCEKQGKYAGVVTENQRYVGEMDESAYNATKRLGKAARIIGLGSSAVGIGASAVDAATGEGYEVEMEFVCR